MVGLNLLKEGNRSAAVNDTAFHTVHRIFSYNMPRFFQTDPAKLRRIGCKGIKRNSDPRINHAADIVSVFIYNTNRVCRTHIKNKKRRRIFRNPCHRSDNKVPPTTRRW